MKSDVIEGFKNVFSVELAVTPEQKSKVYGVRYRVYCDEFGYEPLARFSKQEETDEYDAYSLHCLITHKKSTIPAACFRLIPNINEIDRLPIEIHCKDSLDYQLIESLGIDKKETYEVSRIAVDRFFRRRTGENLTRFGAVSGMETSSEEERTFPLISLALFLACIACTDMTDKKGAYALMEPFLPRLLRRSGLKFKKIGDEVNYRGIRAPYYLSLELALSGMNESVLDFYEWIYLQLNKAP